jgi:hypothetical protein
MVEEAATVDAHGGKCSKISEEVEEGYRCTWSGAIERSDRDII